ncbi:MAG: hypothetical protein K1000chlam2_00698 [Chlamydiae bacterium]|nr:hypothetical protein [Chlamydiota bacterium]
MSRNIKRIIPFVILIALIIVVYLSNVHHKFTLDWLRNEQQTFYAYVQDHPILSSLIFLGIYIASVCLVIPDSTILTLLGGLVFPLPLAIAYSVISETVGATFFFMIFQGIFGERLIKKEKPVLKKVRKKFSKYHVSYLLFLRLSHVIPFWTTNICAAYFRVNYRSFIWTCFVGVLPLSIIMADAGHSLSEVFAKSGPIHISDIFTIPIKIALLAIGLLALSPIVYKKIVERKKRKK